MGPALVYKHGACEEVCYTTWLTAKQCNKDLAAFLNLNLLARRTHTTCVAAGAYCLLHNMYTDARAAASWSAARESEAWVGAEVACAFANNLNS